PPYRALDARDVQCLAAKASSTGNSLDRDLQQLEESARHHCLPHPKAEAEREAKRTILQNSAVEARNADGAVALEMDYRRAEFEAKLDLVSRSRAELRDALGQTESLRAKGLKPPIDLPVLQRQGLDADIQDRRAQLMIDQLNGELQQRLG